MVAALREGPGGKEACSTRELSCAVWGGRIVVILYLKTTGRSLSDSWWVMFSW